MWIYFTTTRSQRRTSVALWLMKISVRTNRVVVIWTRTRPSVPHEFILAMMLNDLALTKMCQKHSYHINIITSHNRCSSAVFVIKNNCTNNVTGYYFTCVPQNIPFWHLTFNKIWFDTCHRLSDWHKLTIKIVHPGVKTDTRFLMLVLLV